MTVTSMHPESVCSSLTTKGMPLGQEHLGHAMGDKTYPVSTQQYYYCKTLVNDSDLSPRFPQSGPHNLRMIYAYHRQATAPPNSRQSCPRLLRPFSVK